MTDQRIREVNIKETDDGYIIELKGDKDILQDLIFSRRGFRGFGKRMRGHERGHHRGPRQHKRHRHGGAHRRFDLGPWFEAKAPHDGSTGDDTTEAI